MASGHENRARRPNTWLHRPSCKREENPCQRGAVHTWHLASVRCDAELGPLSASQRTWLDLLLGRSCSERPTADSSPVDWYDVL